MEMVHAIVRPEKAPAILKSLKEAGYLPVTKMNIFGRGKQRGLQSGNVIYDEIPKENLYIAAEDDQVEDITNIIMRSARTGEGCAGDGKIFVYPIERVVTISNLQGTR